uniref:Ileal sodium/bile acid cotransporter n=1 Tax=Aceria tosichella TaxID=561515 RepID=A0A6G1S3T9_9ACAR
MFKSSYNMFAWHLFVLVVLNFIQSSYQVASTNPLSSIDYGPEIPFRMNMSSYRELTVNVSFNQDLTKASAFDSVRLSFKTSTVSPQFNILSLDTQSTSFLIPKKQLEAQKYIHTFRVKVHANYIGHALLQPSTVEYINLAAKKSNITPIPDDINKLPVTIVQYEGIWGTIFLISVIILMLLSYISLGAQLDQDNLLQVIKKPKTLILGYLIGVLVMPVIAWFVGQWLFQNQPLYRIGSFVFACSPAASGSTLWTVMLNSDEELSVSLQIVSTVGALFTMPLMFYIMDKSQALDRELQHTIKVPYARLIQTLFLLLVALLIGWQFVGKNPRAQKVSRRIFRPLVFFVLIFIIVFSSILYWHIYQMFDWTITLGSFIIGMSTYIVSGMLGHCINCDMDRAIAISISSVYKNSGVAFAVLLVAFDSPDTYIAYVPCLTQIVMISLSFYLAYTILTLYKYLRRCGQPDVIQATDDTTTRAEDSNATAELGRSGRTVKSDSIGEKSTKSDENDELIAMNVTDIDPEAMTSDSRHRPSKGELGEIREEAGGDS